jgi:hypothetical protein
MSNEINKKAKELVEKYKPLCKDVMHTGILDGLATVMNDDFINHIASKQCAIITCDILMENAYDSEFFDYWREIKNAIEQL